jgi:adenylyltransferase/sulfurtransferase
MSKLTENERYQRQISLKELGENGQQKLKNSKVLVVGAGGLGCPALLYLAGAGIGRIGIVDFDLVSLSNLHRQVLFSVHDIGFSKSLRAADILGQMNPDIEIEVFNQKLDNSNALEIIAGFDIILDGNKASTSTKIPANYRDLFPLPPADNEVLNCEEAGVIGVLPGIIGTMMANETIKLITGIGYPLLNRLLTYNSLNNQFFEMELLVMPETAKMIPKNADSFKAFNYNWFCHINSHFELKHEDFERILNEQDIQIVDVREQGEELLIDDFKHIHIPLSQLKEQIPDIDAQTIVLFCQSGKRSASAAEILSKHYGQSRKIFSLKDGIAGWQKNK